MNRLFDDVDNGNREKVLSPQKYRSRLNSIAAKIDHKFRYPQIIALQEVENRNVLIDIAKTIKGNNGPAYQAVLLEGNDRSGIDVGYLIQTSISIKRYQQLFEDRLVGNSRAPLFSRPPLLVEACFDNDCLTIVNVHLRSMRGLRSQQKGKRVALKRLSQANALAQWVNDFQTRNQQASIILTGDFNALTPSDSYADIIGTILGNPDNSQVKYKAKDWVEKDLVDLTLRIKEVDRYSYTYKGQKQILDYLLVNQNFSPTLQRIKFSSVDQKFSDHAGLLAIFSW
ncbi:MAG: hypothetical protein OEY09_19015 [Gammaproteobacteria bacterium]|nr:hypothetical protein [Gammaproteobacteria bacterium]